MAHILVIGYSPRKIAPYLSFYIDLLKKEGISFDYMTRDFKNSPMDESVESNQIVYSYLQPSNPIGKIINILRWRKAALNQMKKGYDFIICLTCYPAIILSDILCKKYNSKYIVDIRDYQSFLRHSVFMQRLTRALVASKAVMISSEGFKQWLPKLNNVHVIHNMPSDIHESKSSCFKHDKTHPITIGYLGVVNYYSQNEKIICALSNDRRYRMAFFGIYSQPGRFEKYCEKNNISNVVFNGAFENKNKPILYETIDIINAVYGNDSLTVTTALPNKLYDSVLYNIPIMVSSGTYLATIVKNYNLGFAIDLTKDIKMQLDEYWNKFDKSVFESGAMFFKQKCIQDNENAIHTNIESCRVWEHK